MKAIKKSIYPALPVLGILFCLWYICTATSNIVYTDYIRLVNTYLPDVWSAEKFFVPDILTRIPVYYLGRIINVTFFGYSTTFDMVLGVLGLGLSGLVLGAYCKEWEIPAVWYLILIFVFFNLNKWEMLTNGSGWAHFLAFAGFYYHYLVLDRIVSRREKKNDRKLLLLLPFVNTLLIAGPYCAVYTVTMILFCFYAMISQMRERRKQHQQADIGYWLKAQICILIPFFLYLWSNSYAVEDHANTYDISLLEVLQTSPGFFVRFLLKSLASTVIGGETLEIWLNDPNHIIGNKHVYLLGAVVALAFLVAFVLFLRTRMYNETIFPAMLFISGIGNYGIVLISRYIFLNENYGMSSRYALQYQAGLLGVLLIFALAWRSPQLKAKAYKAVLIPFVILIVSGMAHTNYKEIQKAPYRKASMELKAAAALRFEELDDTELPEIFEYRKSRADSGEKVRQALTVLKENEWNVFRKDASFIDSE